MANVESLYHKARLAKKLFSEGAVDHLSKENSRYAARDFLTQAGCPSDFVDVLLSVDNKWQNLTSEDFFSDFYELSPEELDQQLREFLLPFYTASTRSLDHIYPEGFARHDEGHIDMNAERLKQLMEEAQVDEGVQRRALAAVRIHDIGNLLSRKVHSFISSKIFEFLVSQVKKDPKQWRIIRRAIQLHDEPIAFAFIDALEEKYKGFSREGMYNEMREIFGPEALLLAIADKTEQGPHRVSQKPTDGEWVVSVDPHLINSLLGKTESLSFSSDKKIFIQKIVFDASGEGRNEQGIDRFIEPSAHHGGRKLRVSQTFKNEFEEQGVTYFENWQRNFWKYNTQRVRYACLAVFSQFPNVETYEVKFVDKGLPEKNILASEVVVSFGRESMKQDLAAIG